ncbi:hypothetical protein [Lysobacter sp. GCM10012299]|uniref:hypothetical protein n=1 Tax=Lysobacter sp. GCM10012299 TaxID=3317333 RepID=UPI0036228C75
MEPTQQDLKRAPRMRLHFNVHDPVELVEMTLAFQGLGHEYQSYLRARFADTDPKSNAAEVKLYLTRIESNCILAELAPALPMLGAIAPVLADVNTVHDFVEKTAKAIRWLIGVAKKKGVTSDEIPYGKRQITNLRDVVRLVAKNHNSNLGLAAIRYEQESGQDRAVLEFSFTDFECRRAEQGASIALAALDVREKADREKVLMYFYQTNIEDPKAGGRTGDKAIISSISREPLSVYIIPETDQQKVRYVLDDKSHNPLHTGFVVDVNIENDRQGRPRIYRVVRVHDVVYDDSDA